MIKSPSKAASTMPIGIDIPARFGTPSGCTTTRWISRRSTSWRISRGGGLPTPTASLWAPSAARARSGPLLFCPINDFQGLSSDQVAANNYPDLVPAHRRVDRLQRVLRPGGATGQGTWADPRAAECGGALGRPRDLPPGCTSRKRAPYQRIDLQPLEYLSRSVTVPLLYASPTVGDEWKRQVKRKRVRMWTEEAQVMTGWHAQFKSGLAIDQQTDFLKWVSDAWISGCAPEPVLGSNLAVGRARGSFGP